jgi:hypothetical protein
LNRKAGCICPRIWNAFPDSPDNVREALSRSICRQARRQKLNTNKMSAAQILSAVTKVPGFQDNSTSSKGPGNPGVAKDKAYPDSSYGTDMQSCLDSLSSLNISPETAREECEKQYGGKGTVSGKSGNKLLVTAKQTSMAIGVHSASVDPEIEIPAWSMTQIGGPPNLIKSNASNIKSASEQKEQAITNYMLMREISHKDGENRVEPNAEMEQLVHERGVQLAEAAENRRIKSGKKEPVDDRPYWIRCNKFL